MNGHSPLWLFTSRFRSLLPVIAESHVAHLSGCLLHLQCRSPICFFTSLLSTNVGPHTSHLYDRSVLLLNVTISFHNWMTWLHAVLDAVRRSVVCRTFSTSGQLFILLIAFGHIHDNEAVNLGKHLTNYISKMFSFWNKSLKVAAI